MKYKIYTLVFVLIIAMTFGFTQIPLVAGEQEPEPGTLAVFSNQKRPAPQFDHDHHESIPGDEGCAKCHHVFDNEKNALVYSEGDESACNECHMETAQGNTPALREASHSLCNACHRQMKKLNLASGPTTCGECHKK